MKHQREKPEDMENRRMMTEIVASLIAVKYVRNHVPPWMDGVMLDAHYPTLGLVFHYEGEPIRNQHGKARIIRLKRRKLCRHRGITLIEVEPKDLTPVRMDSLIRDSLGRAGLSYLAKSYLRSTDPALRLGVGQCEPDHEHAAGNQCKGNPDAT